MLYSLFLRVVVCTAGGLRGGTIAGPCLQALHLHHSNRGEEFLEKEKKSILIYVLFYFFRLPSTRRSPIRRRVVPSSVACAAAIDER